MLAPGSAARRLRLTAILLALSCVLLALSAAHASAAPKNFGTPRFQTNDTGDITYVSNTLSTCQDGSTSGTLTCADGRAGRNALYNNLVPNQPVTVGSPGAGFPANSSSSTFALPTGAQVLWAGLYWGADPGSVDGATSVPNPAKTIRLRVPGSANFQTLTAADADFYSGAPAPHLNAYQGFANVTNIVKAAGGGVYTAGGIPLFSPSNPGNSGGAGQANDSYGGWSLVIVTKDAAQPSRNLSVFDGLVGVTNSPKVEPTINVSGFVTPPAGAGAVNTKLGIIAYEGDRGIQGDYAQLNGRNLADAGNPATNFFNSSQTTLGARRTGMTPDYDNTFGYDADIFDATGYIPNGATSASIKLGTTGDVYAPGVVTLATELYAPKFTPTKSVANVTPGRTGPTRRGDTLRYTVSYENTGGDAAAGVRIDDSIPANTTYVPGSLRITSPGTTQTPTDAAGDDTAEYNAADDVVRFRPGAGADATTGGRIAVRETATVTFDVKVDDDLADNTRIDNSAQASYRAETSGTSFTDLATPVATTFVRAPDLQIAKTITTAPIGAGDNERFSLAVTNTGGAPTSGTVTVRDEVPVGAFPTVRSAGGTGWTCSVVGQLVTCTRDDALPAGQGYPPIVIEVTAANNLPATVQNDTTVSGGGDSNTTNNTGTATGTGTNRSDIKVSKRFGQSSAIVGGTVTWTLDVNNDGPSNATNVSLRDVVPAGLNVTRVVTSRGACTTAQTIDCALGDIPANSGASVTVTATVTGTPGTISNTATAGTGTNGAPGADDPNGANNTSTATLTVNPSADVSITKTGPATPPNAGAPYAFTLTVANAGPDTAQNVTVTDGIPDNFTVNSVAAPAGVTCDTNADRILCTAPTLASGQSRVITINGTSADGGLVTNVATADSTTADPNANNNSATAVATVGTLADVSLVKTFGNANPVNAGAQTTVTLAASNAGPSTAADVAAVDTLPAGLTFVSGANCSAAAQVVTCQYGNIASGATVTRTITVQVSSTAKGNVTNTARAESPTTTDPFPGNNSSSATLALSANADLAITNVATPGTVNPGADVQWTVTATNNGPTQAENPVFTVRVPDGVDVSTVAIVSNSAGSTCGLVDRVITCRRPTLDSGASSNLVFTGTVAQSAAGTTLTDPASVTSDTGDANLGNNQATASVAVNRRYAITLTKTPTTQTVAPNQAVTFTLQARNAGPNDANGVSLIDALPAGTVFVSADPGCAADGRTVTCAVGDLPSGRTVERTLTIRTTDANAGSTIQNQLTHTTTDPASEDVNRGDAARASVVVSPSADLAVTITPNPTSTVAGAPVTWTVVGTNNGPSQAVTPTFVVTLPTGVTPTGFTGAGCSVSTDQRTLTCNRDSLNPGASFTGTITGTIDEAKAGGVVDVPARIDSPTPDPNPANNTAPSRVTVAPLYRLQVEKTADQPRVGPNQDITYTLKVTNNGPSQANDVTLVDPLPANTTLVSATPGCTVVATTVSCPVGNLANGASESRQITVRTSNATAGTTVTNQATYTTSDPASVDANRGTPAATGTAAVEVTPLVDLGITKSVTPGRVTAGGEVVYTLDVVNNGPNGATGVVVSDALPAGLTVLQTSPTQGTCSTAGRSVRCDLGAIAVGGRAQVVIRARADAAGTPTNQAGVTSDQADGNPADNTSANVPLIVDPAPAPPANPPAAPAPADLVLNKELISKTVEVGRVLTYRITVTNRGGSVARGVRVTDVPSRTVAVLGVKPTVGSCPGRSPITCNLGDLAPGQTAQVTVSVRVNVPGKLSNAATAVAIGSPEVPAETDVADTSVRRLAASVSVKKTASARTVRGGSSVKFSIRVKNFTRKTVRKVLVCDTLPRGLVFQKASPLKITGRKACGTIATLKAGQTRTFVVTVRAESRKTAKTLRNAARAVVPNELSSKASRAIRVTPGPGATGNGGVTG